MSVTSSLSRTPRMPKLPAGRLGSWAACIYVQRAFSVRRICLQLKVTERTDQRICIKFCFNLGKSCTETIEMIQMAFVGGSMSIAQIKEW